MSSFYGELATAISACATSLKFKQQNFKFPYTPGTVIGESLT